MTHQLAEGEMRFRCAETHNATEYYYKCQYPQLAKAATEEMLLLITLISIMKIFLTVNAGMYYFLWFIVKKL